jgi:hypothetical protein
LQTQYPAKLGSDIRSHRASRDCLNRGEERIASVFIGFCNRRRKDKGREERLRLSVIVRSKLPWKQVRFLSHLRTIDRKRSSLTHNPLLVTSRRTKQNIMANETIKGVDIAVMAVSHKGILLSHRLAPDIISRGFAGTIF